MPMTLDDVLADRTRWRADRCSIDKAIGVIGSRSAMLFVREAFYGTTRFADFVERVGVTDAAAATRLKQLVADGVLERRKYQESGSRARYEYVLTAKGSALLPVILAMMAWGDEYLQPDGAPLEVVDRQTQRPVEVSIRTASGEEAHLDELAVRVPRRTRA